MDNVIIGTAGHIDHGKTTLIKALTGRSTDTLEEEIKRGISINLGFTYFDLPGGNRAGIIDVPGHEKFIKNMIAGAVGIDIVLVTIAANEGVKPQTIEHLDILKYLDIKEAIFVLTKSDLADEIMTEIVIDDIEELKKDYEDSVISKAEIIPVDSLSGRGMDKLIEKIDIISQNIHQRNTAAQARLNIDRVFSLKGFGTIITGTLVEGKISAGDELMVYPMETLAKIRNVQVHEKNVNTAFAGQRTALNIANLRVEDLERGDVLAKPNSMTPTNLLDVKINTTTHTKRELELWTRLRVYIGSKEVLARLVPLDRKKINASESSYCQLRLEESVVVKRGDKFVIRYYSPMETIGGGVILDPNPTRHGRGYEELIEELKLKEKGDEKDVLESFILNSEIGYRNVKEMEDYMSKDSLWINDSLEKLSKEEIVFNINGNYYHTETIERMREKIIEILSDFHNENPLRAGLSKEILKSKLVSKKNKDYGNILKLFQDENLIKIIDGLYVALFGFEIIYDENQKKIKAELEKLIYDGGFAPPSIKVITKNNQKEYMEVLENLIPKLFVKLDDDTAIHIEYYNKALELLKDFMKDKKDFTLGEFRDLISSTRKYAVLLLDDFDKNKITERQGEKRILLN